MLLGAQQIQRDPAVVHAASLNSATRGSVISASELSDRCPPEELGTTNSATAEKDMDKDQLA